MIFIFSLLIALASFFLIVFVLISFNNAMSTNIFHRMRRHNVKPLIKREVDEEKLILRAYRFVKKISRPLVEHNFAQSLENHLNRAGLPLLGGEYVVINLIGMVAAAFLTWILTLEFRISLIISIIVPAALWSIIMMLKSRRLNSFTEQLGDCLITISNALRAGYSFQQTIEVISKEMEPPISQEFSQMNHEIVMGVPLEEALENANKRIGSTDFELVVTAVLIQREVGGNLAQVLDNISYTIAERIRLRREILAITAQGRLSAIVLVLLPFAAAAAMLFINRDHFMQMLDEPMGQYALIGAFVLEIVGYIVIRHIVNIEV